MSSRSAAAGSDSSTPTAAAATANATSQHPLEGFANGHSEGEGVGEASSLQLEVAFEQARVVSASAEEAVGRLEQLAE